MQKYESKIEKPCCTECGTDLSELIEFNIQNGQPAAAQNLLGEKFIETGHDAARLMTSCGKCDHKYTVRVRADIAGYAQAFITDKYQHAMSIAKKWFNKTKPNTEYQQEIENLFDDEVDTNQLDQLLDVNPTLNKWYIKSDKLLHQTDESGSITAIPLHIKF